MDDQMMDAEQKVVLIEEYVNLQRIKTAQNRDEEIEFQIKAVRAKLNVMGINVENLCK